ncbi:MAG: GxxExxY protein [Limisphaerales bacterium]
MEVHPSHLLYQDESYAVRGALYEVYRVQGSGFVEPVYHECLKIELDLRRIPFVSKPRTSIEYKDRRLNTEYIPDFICHDRILIELKAVSQLANEHRAQLHNYLRVTGLRLGFLANFGHHPGLELERIIR